MSHHALNAARREADLEALQADPRPLDVLVIGGGVTGAGVALDAASRGLRTALVERRDLAWGTSRWSSKLVHGGLRYLAQGAFGIAMESARERHVLLTRTAPHLVHPIVQAVPFTPQVSAKAERELRGGLALGDGLRRAAGTSARELPRARRASADELLRIAPGVDRAGLRGALISHDAQLEDDARLVVGLARTAAAHGASILTRVAATQVAGDGAQLRDELSGATFDVRARAVINATGVWAGELIDDIRLRPSRGTHLVVPLDRLGGLAGQLTVPVPGERNRWVFAIAQRTGVAYVGLTDEPAPGPIPDVPAAPEADVDFLLATLNATLARPLTRDDVVGTYAGLRPLVESSEAKTADLSRKHAVIRSGGGLVSVVGGKLTTYRQMAQDAVDAAVDAGGLAGAAGACRTKDLPLVGAAPRDALAAVAAPRRLVDRHGTLAPDVLALAGGDPDLLAPMLPGLDVLAVEALYAVECEGALDADDVLDRRTRIGLVDAARVQARPVVDALLARSGQASAA
ncbi:Glycerol-3-phosphate dehydrogenase 1 [Baekduia alba]|uniref:glycerol-3-phosphate dehydrogenase/oxidase n=1 Tax=Baekduia alba TaxID=2997333 RepID=UPI002341120E|nr:glycerol-3-phosphate dehydrogenase/oxidase [Baekduia alba]WCB96439.1 Glycerol-3-phosphate dehydrogenase 1 [Baekduia alba]